MTLPDPNSSRFFCQLGKIELEGSSAFLDAQQVYLRENKICGFIEIQVSKTIQVVLLFAPEGLAGTYLLDEDNNKPLQMMNLSTVWDGKPKPIRTVELPQIAGRMTWLALESQISGRMEIAGKQEFEKQLNTWKSGQFSGTVEIITEKAQGVFYIHEGSPLNSESFFYSDQGFTNTFANHQIQEQYPLKIIIHKSSPASQSQQVLMLRQGILNWGNGILRRYQELAGQKLIRMMQKDIEDVTLPWGWNLSIENSMFRDEHFFPHPQTAAQAYRAIFMELGNQMEQVVGSALARRILSETFETLNKNARAALELHRLIPAAFSE